MQTLHILECAGGVKGKSETLVGAVLSRFYVTRKMILQDREIDNKKRRRKRRDVIDRNIYQRIKNDAEVSSVVTKNRRLTIYITGSVERLNHFLIDSVFIA